MPMTPEQYKETNKKNRPDYDPEQGRLVLIDPSEIDHDTPVDRAHVDALKQSLSVVGQLTPILVRRATSITKGELLVIDGFHRVAALKELGTMITANEIDCNDEDFWAARIVSATQHEGVKVDRAALWIEELWAASPYTDKYKTVTAAISSADTGKATSEIQALVKGWSDAWGIAIQTLRAWVGYGTTHPKPTETKIVSNETKTPLIEAVPQTPEMKTTMKMYYGNLSIIIEGGFAVNCTNMTKQEIKEYLIRSAEAIAAIQFGMKVLESKK